MEFISATVLSRNYKLNRTNLLDIKGDLHEIAYEDSLKPGNLVKILIQNGNILDVIKIDISNRLEYYKILAEISNAADKSTKIQKLLDKEIHIDPNNRRHRHNGTVSDPGSMVPEFVNILRNKFIISDEPRVYPIHRDEQGRVRNGQRVSFEHDHNSGTAKNIR